jgi:hypothetical protein
MTIANSSCDGWICCYSCYSGEIATKFKKWQINALCMVDICISWVSLPKQDSWHSGRWQGLPHMASHLSYNAHEGATTQDPIQFAGMGTVLGREAVACLLPFEFTSHPTKLGRWTAARIMGCHAIFSVCIPSVTTRQPHEDPGNTVHEQHERYLASQA